MSWSRPLDFRRELEQLWQRGTILRSLLSEESLFPYKLRMRCPSSRALGENFAEVRQWIGELSAAQPFRIEWRTVNHRTLGTNQIPVAVWIDTLDAAVRVINKQRSKQAFEHLIAVTCEAQPELLAWLKQRPLRSLELKDIWQQLLDVVNWVVLHPYPGIYLRQLELPGVHTKLVEQHRGVLSELLDLVLPSEFIMSEFKGVAEFCQRYGFRNKPHYTRLRSLDPEIRLLPTGSDQDITITEHDFAALQLPIKRVFITENEINFLALPDVVDSIAVFGRGYGVATLANAEWLHQQQIYYWGDIDTHGFAILDQLRQYFPQTKSMLMDQETLLAHQEFWVRESEPSTAILNHLTPAEHQLYEQLMQDYWGIGVRLEQERVRYTLLTAQLAQLL